MISTSNVAMLISFAASDAVSSLPLVRFRRKAERVTRLVCAEDVEGKKRERVEPTEQHPLAWCKERMGTKDSFSFAGAFAVLISRQASRIAGRNANISVKYLQAKNQSRAGGVSFDCV